MYSKSIGALNSNGEYIIELDQDDMFIRENVFQILYSEATAITALNVSQDNVIDTISQDTEDVTILDNLIHRENETVMKKIRWRDDRGRTVPSSRNHH